MEQLHPELCSCTYWFEVRRPCKAGLPTGTLRNCPRSMGVGRLQIILGDVF